MASKQQSPNSPRLCTLPRPAPALPHLRQHGLPLILQHGRHKLRHSVPHSVALIRQQLIHLFEGSE